MLEEGTQKRSGLLRQEWTRSGLCCGRVRGLLPSGVGLPGVPQGVALGPFQLDNEGKAKSIRHQVLMIPRPRASGLWAYKEGKDPEPF